MKHLGVFLFATLALAAAAAQGPRTVAWRNGAWFDGAGFRRLDVYSVGSRLSLKPPSKISPELGTRPWRFIAWRMAARR